MTSPRKIAQADDLIDFLRNNHGVDIATIRRHLRDRYSWPYDAPNLIHFIRNVYGDNAVLCWYSYYDGSWVYGLARSLQEGHSYVGARTMQLRNTAVNISTIVDRLLAEFPNAARADRQALQRTRDDLQSVIDTLNHA